MKNRQNSRDGRHLVHNTTLSIARDLLIWSAMILVGGVGSAQTGPTQSLSNQSTVAPALTGLSAAAPVEAKPVAIILTQTAVPTVAPATTNAPRENPETLLQIQLSWSSRQGDPLGMFREPKANELTLGLHTYSGIVVQAIKTKPLLELFSPAAPSAYGSGWDNIDQIPSRGSGHMLKLFSINF